MNDFDFCKGCGNKRIIENKKYGLCHECNFKRIHGKSEYESYKDKNSSLKKNSEIKIQKKSHFIQKQNREKRLLLLERDRRLYKYIFDNVPCFCEECGVELPYDFEDDMGNIVCIEQYSHILGKQAYPEFRHHKLNVNRLCFKHHQQWEFGDREKMNLYFKNLETIEYIRNNPKMLVE